MRHEKILILGGTKEAAALASHLAADGLDVTTSLAGRTKEPQPVAGKVRIGGFGGAEGLAAYLLDNSFTKIIDCTHPFARQISANAALAAEKAGVELQVITRPAWAQVDGDFWIPVESLDDAAASFKSGARVLLALGKQYLDAFQTRPDCYFVIRMVEPPEKPLELGPHEVLIGKPSADWQTEAELFKGLNIDTIVCRNSGGDGAYAKIAAARELGLPVVMLER